MNSGFAEQCPEEYLATLLRLSRDTAPQRTEEWYKKRSVMLTTASQIGKPSDTEKAMDEFSPAIRHGCDYEDEALFQYQQKFPDRKVIQMGMVTEEDVWGPQQLPELFANRVGGSPDAITYKIDEETGKPTDFRLLEIKCPYWNRHYAPDKTQDYIEKWYMPQIQCLLIIFGLSVAELLIYYPVNEDQKATLYIHTIPASVEKQALLMLKFLAQFDLE